MFLFELPKKNSNPTTKWREITTLYLGILLLLLLMDVSFGFSIPTSSVQYSLRDYRLQHRTGTQCYEKRSDSNIEKEAGGEEWTLDQDWALMDQVPKFTVGEEGSNVRTFWTQLAASTPILCNKEPEEMMERCQTLKKEKPIQFGPSPSLLLNWDVANDPNTNNRNVVVGETRDGRTIWLQYHCIGRLQGDVLKDMSSSVISLLPGGYLEAVGGRVYELGQRRILKDDDGKDKVSLWDNRSGGTNSRFSSFGSDPTSISGSSEKEKDMTWWLPATTGTLSALVASTILSACIGYGAGLSIISDGSSESQPMQLTTVSTISNTKALDGTSRNLPSPSERKARAEYRILREERMIDSISNRLQQDRLELQALKEQQQTPALSRVSSTTLSSSTTTKAPAPSLAEKQAGAEYRILREERVIQKITEQLEKDQVELQKLNGNFGS